MRPLACNYYVTLRCNDACEFCPHWRQTPSAEEASLDQIKENLRGLKSLGVLYLDITGGEPLLRNDLPAILAYAKKLKLFTTLTTNCLLFPEKGAGLMSHCDRLLFSLDFPDAKQHNASRDEKIFGRVIESINLAKSHGKNPIINYTVTRDSVRFLPEMEEFADKYKVLVWLNPAYKSPAHKGLTRNSIEYVKYFFKKKKFIGNLAIMELLSNFGNNTNWPVCQAARSTITITPDSSLVAPCYYNQKVKIKINNDLKNVFNGKKYKQALASQGKDGVCAGCMISSYLIHSFWYRLDRYFFMNLFSGWRLLFKEYLMTKQ